MTFMGVEDWDIGSLIDRVFNTGVEGSEVEGSDLEVGKSRTEKFTSDGFGDPKVPEGTGGSILLSNRLVNWTFPAGTRFGSSAGYRVPIGGSLMVEGFTRGMC